MKRLVPVVIGSILLFQPANDITSQVGKRSKPKDTTSQQLKQSVDTKATEVLKSLDTLEQKLEDKADVQIKWRTKWKTKLKTIHDTIVLYQCPPDSSGWQMDEPEVIIKLDTVFKKDTIIIKKKSLFQKIKDIF